MEILLAVSSQEHWRVRMKDEVADSVELKGCLEQLMCAGDVQKMGAKEMLDNKQCDSSPGHRALKECKLSGLVGLGKLLAESD